MTLIRVLQGKMKSTDKPLVFVFQMALISVVLTLLSAELFLVLGAKISNLENVFVKDISARGGEVAVLFVVVLLAPLFETLIFQFGLMQLFRKILCFLTKKRTLYTEYIIPGLISAVLFVLDHRFSVVYMLSMILPAAILQYVIIKLYLDGADHKRAILYTAVCHSLHNFFIWMIVFSISLVP